MGPDPSGTTLLAAEDLEGLIPRHVTTRAQLDELEEQNILECRAWIRSARARPDPLDYVAVLTLHRRMFGSTWRWAGTLRTRETNIGVAPSRIATYLRQLLDNLRHRAPEDKGGIDAFAVEYHHRMVAIHPFANGNGRHARLAADLLLAANGAEPFSWGRATLGAVGLARDRYLEALRAADGGSYAKLSAFVRS